MSNDLFGLLFQHGYNLKAEETKRNARWSIRARFRDAIGRHDFKLPYAFTSETNAEATCTTLNGLHSEDQALVIKEFSNSSSVNTRTITELIFLLVSPEVV